MSASRASGMGCGFGQSDTIMVQLAELEPCGHSDLERAGAAFCQPSRHTWPASADRAWRHLAGQSDGAGASVLGQLAAAKLYPRCGATDRSYSGTADADLDRESRCTGTFRLGKPSGAGRGTGPSAAVATAESSTSSVTRPAADRTAGIGALESGRWSKLWRMRCPR